MSRWAVLVGLGMGAACFEFERNDGESCTRDAQCRSGTCGDGRCHSARTKCKSASDCRSQYVCVDPATWEQVLSLGLARGTCHLACEFCPMSDWYACSGPACLYEGEPKIEIGGPYEGSVASTFDFFAIVETDNRKIANITWSYDQGGEIYEFGDELEFSHRFDAPIHTNLTLIVEDDSGRMGRASTTLLVCGELGDDCSQAPCCDGLECGTDPEVVGVATCRTPS